MKMGMVQERLRKGDLKMETHCVKSVLIRSFSGQYFPAFGVNTRRYGVSLYIQSECWKIWTRKTLNMDNFHAVTEALICAAQE